MTGLHREDDNVLEVTASGQLAPPDQQDFNGVTSEANSGINLNEEVGTAR